MYDSEEEAHEEKEYEKRQEKKQKVAAQEGVCLETLKAPLKVEDTADELKKLQKYKPVAGVKFTEFDELGLPKNDGNDYYKYVTTATDTLDTVIEASPE